jgi:cytochrome c
MDSFELNKILGAVLGTCLGVLALKIAAGAIFAGRWLLLCRSGRIA